MQALKNSQDAPRSMEPAGAGDVLRRTIVDPRKPMTIADASVASGLAHRDAEAGLHWLTSEYRGHLRVTEDGDLVHLFPTGFTKPWETREAAQRILAAVGRSLAAAGRFIVRAWLLIAMLGYALVFVAVLLAIAFTGRSDRDHGDTGASIIGALLRAVGDALFWTFHPFSPLSAGYGMTGYGDDRYEARWGHGRAQADGPPFYEKVNRFVFGPPVPRPDPHAMRARILEEIRAQKGRIGLADVMRVSGLPRDQADPLMARLMLDHEGAVEVGDNGGIVYRFEQLRRTAGAGTSPRARAAWDTPAVAPPLTGNPPGSNVAIALLNGFNLVASAWALAKGLTLANLVLLLTTRQRRGAPLLLPDDGIPLVLGLIPFLFSVALFVLPLVRAFLHMRAQRAAAMENARLAVLREVLARAPRKEAVPDEALRVAFRDAAGYEPTSKEITARVAELGGDVDVGSEGQVRYRFADLEAEAEALEREREHASPQEAKLGKVVFASDE